MIVHQTETATDHGIADLADRQRTRHRARPAQPDQPVGSGEFVDGGAAVEPIQPVPEGQGLGVAEQVADRTFDHQPPIVLDGPARKALDMIADRNDRIVDLSEHLRGLLGLP